MTAERVSQATPFSHRERKSVACETMVASSPGHPQILSRCEIKSGSGLGTRLEAWMVETRTKARCWSLRLAPRWHGAVTSPSLSFRFIPRLPLAFAPLVLQGVDFSLLASDSTSSSLPLFCRCHAMAVLCYYNPAVKQ